MSSDNLQCYLGHCPGTSVIILVIILVYPKCINVIANNSYLYYNSGIDNKHDVR